MLEPTDCVMVVRLAGHAGIPGQVPFTAIVVDVAKDIVSDAHFLTYGCPAVVSCGRLVCECEIVKSLCALKVLDEARVVRGIGQMPLGREHCPGLAVTALRSALEQIRCSESLQEGRALCR